MSIEERKNAKGEKVYRYVPLKQEIVFEKYERLKGMLKDYLETIEISEDDVCVNEYLVCHLLIRVDKRKEYFIIYHDETYINEIKETALLAYWIIRFKPFTLVELNGNDSKEKLRINEGFAAFLILGAIKGVKKKDFKISKEHQKKLMYALKYWDISKEAMMLIAETLFESMPVVRR